MHSQGMTSVTQMNRILEGTRSKMRLLVASVREASEISQLAALVRAGAGARAGMLSLAWCKSDWHSECLSWLHWV